MEYTFSILLYCDVLLQFCLKQYTVSQITKLKLNYICLWLAIVKSLLNYYGVRDVPLSLISTYLKDRSQAVYCNNSSKFKMNEPMECYKVQLLKNFITNGLEKLNLNITITNFPE